MCARYLIDDDSFDINEIINAAERNIKDRDLSTAGAADADPVWQRRTDGSEPGSVEVFPGTYAPVIDANNNAHFMLWGFPSLMHGKQPHINARSETAAVKKTFGESMHSRRCLVPASGFYEWKTVGKKQKEKYEITLPDRVSMYMAGIYSEDGRFAVLTRDASPSVAQIHDRMPVILPKALGELWLHESQNVFMEALTEMHLRHIPRDKPVSPQMSLFS